ncbi:MAG: putative HTH-type transcriptional regulator YdcH [Microbacteriaceae bacterium]|nr:putative HTH-type transcriptional regulator YdcH [Microbacteriaceae bacterium]
MTELRGPLASPGYWLRRAAQDWRRQLGVRLRPLDLTPTQFDVLAATSWLGRSGTSPTQQDIADFSGNDRMMTSKVLRTLETRQLVGRTPDGTDARTNRLSVTEAGRALVTGATAIARSVDADLFAGLGDVNGLRDQLMALVEG